MGGEMGCLLEEKDEDVGQAEAMASPAMQI